VKYQDFLRPAVQRVVFDRVREVVTQSVHLKELELHAHLTVDEMARRLVMSLEHRLLRGVPTEYQDEVAFSWPADWWQAFKERWFPRWLLKKYPVAYRTEVVARKLVEHRYCPHIRTPPGNGDKVCFDYLLAKDEW